MTDLMNRPLRAIGKRVAKKTAARVVVGLLGSWGFWIVLVLILLMVIVIAVDSEKADATANTAAAAGAGAVSAPAGADARIKNAAVIVNVAHSRGLSQQAATIGVSVAIAESNLLNYANDGTSEQLGHFSDGHRPLDAAERAVARQSLTYPHQAVGHDLDSMGLFQQRPSASWGTPAQLMDPAASAGKFFDALAHVIGWQNMDPWVAAQTVQGSNSSDGAIYQSAYHQAGTIVAQLGTPAAASAGGSVPITGGVSVPLPANAGLVGTITAPTPTVAKALAAGLAWIGEPYSWGGGSDTGPTLGICGPDGAENDCHITGFDCSGLTMYMWAQVGIHLNHFTADQWAESVPLSYDQRQPGDMIGYEGHITMFIGTFNGVDMQLEAPYSGAFVRVSKVRESHFPTVYRVWTGK